MNFKLLILVISTHIVSIIFGIILVFVGDRRCFTTECKKAASIIKDYVDVEIQPCDDFYAFACGKMNESDKGLLIKTKDSLELKIVEFLEEIQEREKPEAFRIAKSFYQQCLQHESIVEMKSNIVCLIKDVGWFPALQGDLGTEEEKNWNILNTLVQLRTKGLNTDAFFTLTTKNSPFDSSKFLPCISVQKPYLAFKPQTLATCDDTCQKSLSSMYSQILSFVGVNASVVHTETIQLLALDMKIANLTYKRVPLLPHDYKDRTTTVKSFMSKYNFFDWKSYFNMMLKQFGKNNSLLEDSLIIIDDPEYLSEIKSIIETTSKKQLANYLIWYNLLQLLYYPGFPRNSYLCLNMYMLQTIPQIMNSLAVRVRDESSYGAVNDMIKNIRRELISELELATWLDENTRKEALDKIGDMEVTIGYLKLFLDDDLIDRYYNGLVIGKTFFESYINILKHKSDQQIHCLIKSFNDDLCHLMIFGAINMISPNAFYMATQNEIVIPDSILRQPIFAEYWPKYINYGRVGYLLGHEITHSLDTRGSHYDKEGKLKDWWDNRTFEQFQEKANCFVDQFSEFQFFNGKELTNLPGNVSVGENIADNGGLKISFTAYKKEQGMLPDLLLPDVEYTQNQLAFISLAQFYCSRYAAMDYPIVFYDVHAPNPLRVKGMMQNSHEFSEAFSCEAGSTMNPSNKCELW